METVQIQLPPALLQQVQQVEDSRSQIGEVSSAEALSQVVAEALQMWLEKQLQIKTDQEKALQMLRQAGLVMTSERQRAFAEGIMATLPRKGGTSTRAQVEASLAKLQIPLSEEIIAMRGER